MEILFPPTEKQMIALNYYSVGYKERDPKKLPDRSCCIDLWRNGLLGAYWKYNRREGGWKKRFYLPDDIKTQLNSGEPIAIELDTDRFATLEATYRLWQADKVEPFWREDPDKEEWRYAVKAVTDRAIAKDTGLQVHAVRDTLKWLDQRGFLVRVRDLYDPESAASNAVNKLQFSGDYSGTADVKLEPENELILPDALPEKAKREIRRAVTRGNNNAYWNHRFTFERKYYRPDPLDHVVDGVREWMAPEILRRAIEKADARVQRFVEEQRTLENVGTEEDPDIRYLQYLTYEFDETERRFEYWMSLAFGGDKSPKTGENLDPNSFVYAESIDAIEKSMREGARFTSRRLGRVARLLEKESDMTPQRTDSSVKV